MFNDLPGPHDVKQRNQEKIIEVVKNADISGFVQKILDNLYGISVENMKAGAIRIKYYTMDKHDCIADPGDVLGRMGDGWGSFVVDPALYYGGISKALREKGLNPLGVESDTERRKGFYVVLENPFLCVDQNTAFGAEYLRNQQADLDKLCEQVRANIDRGYTAFHLETLACYHQNALAIQRDLIKVGYNVKVSPQTMGYGRPQTLSNKYSIIIGYY